MTVFAGRYGPGPAQDQLERSLERDGPAGSVVSGELAAAATSSPAGDIACVLDGRPRIGALADVLGVDPATQPERLLASGFERIGNRVLELIDGEFALVVWASGRGLVARDRLGSRPVFVTEHGGALLFASEVRNLLALLPSRPAPDGEAMERWLARTRMHEERTLLAGIRRLRPGHAIELGGGRWSDLCFWRPRYEPPREVDAAEATPEVRAGLDEAVVSALEGAGRPGVMLSGGLDSSAVAAVAADRAPTAYSGVFPGRPEVDESGRIRRVRERLGLPGVEAQLGAGSPLAGAVDFMRTWELPSVSPNRFLWSPLLRRAAADGVDVLLDGEGGDELFGCARYLIADDLMAGRPIQAVRTARRLPGMGTTRRPRWLGRAVLSYGVRAALPRPLHEPLRAARGRSRGPDWLARRATDDRWAWKRLGRPRWWAQLADTLTADSLGAADQFRREAAMHGLELRHPLRDPALVDLVLRLPPRLAFDPYLDRPLLRGVMARELPADVIALDTKPAFNSLLQSAFAAGDRAALHQLLDDPQPELAARVRRSALAPLLDGAGGPGAVLDLWRLATLELWLRHQSDRDLPERLLERLGDEPDVPFATFEGRPQRAGVRAP